MAEKEADRHNTSNAIARRRLQKGILDEALSKTAKKAKKKGKIREKSQAEKIESRKQNTIFKNEKKLSEPVPDENKEIEIDLIDLDDDPLKALELFRKREIEQLKED